MKTHQKKRKSNFANMSHNYTLNTRLSVIEKIVKKKRAQENSKIERESILTTPTSLSMLNSFLIKSVGKSFDNNSSIKKHKKKMDVRRNFNF
jgi:hypothetical protein